MRIKEINLLCPVTGLAFSTSYKKGCRCDKCKEDKSLKSGASNKRNLIHIKEYSKKRYQDNKEEINKYWREVVYKRDRQKLLEYQKEYAKLNPEKLKEYKKKHYSENKEEVLNKQKEYRKENMIEIIEKTRVRRATLEGRFRSYKGNAKKRGIEFKITKEYLKTLPLKCAYTGIDLTWEANKLNTASLDRVDSSLGYIEGNLVFCCSAINYMKLDNSPEKFIELCNMVTDYNRNKQKEI